MTGPDFRSEGMPMGDGFSVSFSFVDGKLDAEWHPSLPDNSALNRKYLGPFKRARAEYYRQLADSLAADMVGADL